MDFENVLELSNLVQRIRLLQGKGDWFIGDESAIGVPKIMGVDGPAGVKPYKNRRFSSATNYPSLSTVSCSFDKELVSEIAKCIGEEALKNDVGILYAPGVNIKRSPLCGRNFEYFSEDPFLSGKLGAAYVNGLQSTGVAATLKHFAVNNQEFLRRAINACVDERALREIYLTAFEMIVEESNPRSMMAAYNKVNGTYCTENYHLISDILRGEWGYDGVLMSDWGAISDRAKSLNAGLDLEMPENKYNNTYIRESLYDGIIDFKCIDEKLRRILKLIKESDDNLKRAENIEFPDSDYFKSISRKASEESAVLLKNENVLPLSKKEKILVVGKFADKPRFQGGGSSFVTTRGTVSFLDELKAQDIDFTYKDGYRTSGDCYDESLIKQAVEEAKKHDKVLVFAGLTDEYESEGYDRLSLQLPKGQNLLIEYLTAVTNVIVVLHGGSAMEMPWCKRVKAILNMHLGGQMVGAASYRLLFGEVNPSGKLSETYPIKYDDNIVSKYFPMGPRNVEYRESIFVGYRYYDKAEKQVLYPFGFGLSYTDFEYSNLLVEKDGDSFTVTVDVKNIGNMDGKEIVQLYIKDKTKAVPVAIRQLKGFSKLSLKSGEEKTAYFTLTKRDFSYYNVKDNAFTVAGGEYVIEIGKSSREIVLSESVKLSADKGQSKISYPDVYKNLKNASEITKEDFEKILGYEITEPAKPQKGEITEYHCMNDIDVSTYGKLYLKKIKFDLKHTLKGYTPAQKKCREAEVLYNPIKYRYTDTWCKRTQSNVRRFIKNVNEEK